MALLTRPFLPLACMVLLVAFLNSARAQVNFTVDDRLDSRDMDVSDGLCKTRQGTCTIRAAIEQANALGGSSVVTVPKGLYVLTIAGPFEDASAEGDLDIRSDVTLSGAGPRGTGIQSLTDDRILQVHPGATATVEGLTISNGFVDGDGGGIENQGTLFLSRSTVTGNIAVGDGGGIHNRGFLKVQRSTISENWGDNSGGGIANTGTLVVINSTVGENAVPAFGAEMGGGIRNIFGSTRLRNVTINRNSAAQGAAISTDPGASTSLMMTILASDLNNNCQGGFITLGHNLESGNTCGLTKAGDLRNTDPLLGALGNYGGPTNTYQPQPGSPAIDSGESLRCPASDQRRVPRPRDGDGDGTAVCDRGSVEVKP